MKKYVLKLIVFFFTTVSSIAQVTQVTDLNPGLFDSEPTDLFVFEDALFFTAASGSLNRQLYTYDAATNTSTLIPVITSYGTATIVGLKGMIIYKGELYLSIRDNNVGDFFFKYDVSTKSLILFPDMQVKGMIVYDDKIYMSARINTFDGFGYELYAYSSDSNVFTLVRDILTGGYNYDSNPTEFTVLNNKLYFAANSVTLGREFYEYDAPLDFLSAKDIYSGFKNSSEPREFTLYNNQLYFSAYNDIVGQELFKYDPVTQNVTLAANIATGTTNATPLELFVFNNKLYFQATDGNFGNTEFYNYDAQTGQAILLRELAIGTAGSRPRNFFTYKNRLFFEATSQNGGDGFYVYNDNTDVLTELFPEGSNEIDIANPIVFDDKIFFGGEADDFIVGDELYVYDNNSMSLVQDIYPGYFSSEPEQMIIYNNSIYFRGRNDTSGYELFKYNSSSLSTTSFNQDIGVHHYNNAIHISDAKGSLKTKVYNVLGQFVMESKTATISTVALKSGIYIAKVAQGNVIKTLRFIK